MTTRIATTAALALLAAIAILVPPTASAEQLGVDGYYFLDGEAPASFANIDHMVLSEETSGEKQTPSGWIELKNAAATRFVLRNVVLAGQDFTFTTSAVGGVSYRFKGRFVQTGVFSSTQPEGVVLTGHLSKVRANAVVAEADVGFTYFVGD